jgi:hypothetical protein
MSKITIANIDRANVDTPSGGRVVLFADTSNNDNPSVKYSDGTIVDLTDSGVLTGGTYSSTGGTITLGSSDGSSITVTGVTTEVNTGNILYVDNVNGDDNTGQKGSLINKYATIAAAESGATSGDTIIILTMQTNETMLGKDGITYQFIEGAGITNTGNVGLDSISSNVWPMFTDNGKGAISFKVFGGYFYGYLGGDAWVSNQGHACIYLNAGGTCEFDINNILLEGSERGWCFWAQGEATLIGNVKYNASAGNYFIGCLTRPTVNITVGGDVYAAAIFCQAEEVNNLRIKVGGKITVGDAANSSFKYLLFADGSHFFDSGNTNDVIGENQINIEADKIVWLHEGTTQESFFGIMTISDFQDNEATGHTGVFINIVANEFFVAGDNSQGATDLILWNFTRNETKVTFKFDVDKLIVNADIRFANITNSGIDKTKTDLYFYDCSVDWNSTLITSGSTLIDIRRAMWNFNNVRFKLNDAGINLLDDATGSDKEVAIYGGGLYTNAVKPDDVVNIVTELPMSADTTGVYSGLNNIRII